MNNIGYWLGKLDGMNFSLNDAEKIYFTADTHFNHENILGFCSRPFKGVKEHDEALIENWNKKVPDDALVFHLGDVCFGNCAYNRDILKRLNGNIYLVLGNHDIRGDAYGRYKNRFIGMSMETLVTIGDQKIILNHFPLLCFAGSYRKKPVWQLYGHVHTSPYSRGRDMDRIDGNVFPHQYDVGVDNNNFTPVSFAELREIIKVRTEQNNQQEI